jgi:hypothetical protein
MMMSDADDETRCSERGSTGSGRFPLRLWGCLFVCSLGRDLMQSGGGSTSKQ